MKILTMLFCLSVLFLPGYANEPSYSAKKYYCSAGQVELTDSMILIHLDDDTFESDSLCVDQGGVYFTEDMLRCTYCRRPVNPKNICECPAHRSFGG